MVFDHWLPFHHRQNGRTILNKLTTVTFFQDIDGDKRADLCTNTKGQLKCASNNSNAFDNPQVLAIHRPYY